MVKKVLHKLVAKAKMFFLLRNQLNSSNNSSGKHNQRVSTFLTQIGIFRTVFQVIFSLFLIHNLQANPTNVKVASIKLLKTTPQSPKKGLENNFLFRKCENRYITGNRTQPLFLERERKKTTIRNPRLNFFVNWTSYKIIKTVLF